VGDLQDCLLAAGAGDDPFGQAGVESIKDLAQAAVAVLPVGLKPAVRSASSTAATAASTPAGWSVTRSTSAVYRSMMPCRIRALPPPSTNPGPAVVSSGKTTLPGI